MNFEIMSKNRIGQISTETIWKSRWLHAFDNMKNDNSFTLKNGYRTKPQSVPYSKPPSYREYDSNTEERYHRNKPIATTAPKKVGNRKEDKQPLTSHKTTKDVGCCLKTTNFIIGIMITISLILSVIGTATPYWFDTGILNLGLFQSCTKSSSCDSISTYTDSASATTSSTWTIVSVLDICGCCVLFLSTIFYCIYVHCTVVDYRKVRFGVLLSIFVMLGAGAMLSGMAVMVSYYYDIKMVFTLNWSFYAAASGGGLAFLTFIIMLVYVFVLAFE